MSHSMGHQVQLAKECEFRFEVGPTQEFKIKLVSGSAEIFGVELAIDKEYTFRNVKLAVFSWYGCSLETSGDLDVSYLSEETPMVSYINLHAQLHKQRMVALRMQQAGPRVLIAGPVDSGKSTVANILTNYALRLGSKPTLIDLDVGQNCLSIPGALAASPLDMDCISVEEDFILTNPLVYYYGHASPSENPELFQSHLRQLALAVNRRMTNDAEVNASGIVVNTSGWIDGVGYDLLVQSIKAFDVNVVIVIGQDRLYSRLSSMLNTSIAVLKLARSGGVVPLNSKNRLARRMTRIREYFYGPNSLVLGTPTLSPCISEVSFDDIDFYSIKDMKVSDNMLPVGQMEEEMERLQVTALEKSQELTHAIAAVCHLKQQDSGSIMSSELLEAPVAGFVCIKEVRESEKKIVLLVPSPGPLPSRHLVIGSVKWME